MTVLIADCETDGLLDELTKLHCLAFVDADTGELQSFADQPGYRPIEEGLRILMEADLTVWHNGIKFDIPAIRKVYPWWKPRGTVRDSMLTASLVFPKNPTLFDIDARLKKKGTELGNLVGSHALKAWGIRLKLHKGDYSGGWDKWSPEMHTYMEQDVRVTAKLWKRLTKELAEWRSQECVEIEHEVAWIVAWQERHGVAFDKELAARLVGELTQRREKLAGELKSLFPPKVIKVPFIPARDNKTKGWKKGVTVFKEKVVEFNPNSRDQVAARLIEKYGWQPVERTKGGKWKIDDDVLGELPYPEATQLAELFMLDKRLGTLANGKEALLKHEKNGRIHGRVNTNGAVTGRATHSNPNVNLPRVDKPYGPEFRELFKAGKLNGVQAKQVGTDADSLEARVEAGFTVQYDGGAYREMILSGSKEDGTDLHTRNMLAIKPIVATITRDVAKNTKYAWTYGAQDWKLGATAGAAGSRDHVASIGKRIRKRLLAASPGLAGLVKSVDKRLQQRNFLWGLDGRKLAVRAKHAAVNTLFQSAGSVIFKKAMIIRFTKLTGCAPSAYFQGLATVAAGGLIPDVHWAQMLWVHDEVQDEALPEVADRVGQAMADAIREAGEHFGFKCPMAGNYDIGANWRDCH